MVTHVAADVVFRAMIHAVEVALMIVQPHALMIVLQLVLAVLLNVLVVLEFVMQIVVMDVVVVHGSAANGPKDDI